MRHLGDQKIKEWRQNLPQPGLETYPLLPTKQNDFPQSLIFDLCSVFLDGRQFLSDEASNFTLEADFPQRKDSLFNTAKTL